MSKHDFNDMNGPVPAHKHSNGCGWVADTADVSASAYVGPDALVYGDARVYGNARVCGDALVYGNARVYGDACVSGNARAYGDARVSCNARVSGKAEATRSPQNIIGLHYNITVCDDWAIAGCEAHSIADWRSFGEARIREMDGQYAVDFYPHLIAIIDAVLAARAVR